MEFGIYETLMIACLVLLVGHYLVLKINFFKKYNIPEPVVGGFLAPSLFWGAFSFLDTELTFHEGIQQSMMYIFFSSIGLNADFSRLLKGGKALIMFLIIAGFLICFQNLLGISMAKIMNLDLRFGLIAGSITLTGGHGTAGAWADEFAAGGNPLLAAKEIGMACATFGLIFGATIGGPLAYYLLKKNNYKGVKPEGTELGENTDEKSDGILVKERLNYRSVMITVTMLSFCLVLGQLLYNWNSQYSFKLPMFVWCLFTGVVIRNILTHLLSKKVHDESIDVLGNVGLSIFLATALMSLKLWLIVDLALPILVILIMQVTLILIFVANVTYRFMGKDYDAIVISAGHCGFGLGATATAVANIQAVTNRFGPSYKAFLIIPMVGAFFIDILNAIILNLIIPFL